MSQGNLVRLDVPDVRAAVYSAWDGDPEVMGPAFQEWLTGVRRDAVRDALTGVRADVEALPRKYMWTGHMRALVDLPEVLAVVDRLKP